MSDFDLKCELKVTKLPVILLALGLEEAHKNSMSPNNLMRNNRCISIVFYIKRRTPQMVELSKV